MEPNTKFIILKSHSDGVYPGLHPLLRAWRRVVMDPTNKGCEIVVDISTTPALIADQREIGNFLRDHYSRLHQLKISGDRPFHLDLYVTGNTTVNLKKAVNDDAKFATQTHDNVTAMNNLNAIASWSESDNDRSGNESDSDCDSMAHSPPLVMAPRFFVGKSDNNDSGYDSECDTECDDVEFTEAY
jgi:hypothetical protein